MATTLRIRHASGPDTTIVIPDGASVAINPNGDVDVCVASSAAQANYDLTSRIRSGPVSRYTIWAWTTGIGKPPKVGGNVDIFTNVGDVDPSDPEVRPLIRGASVTNTVDPNPSSTLNRKVQIELELTQPEVDRIQAHEHRDTFTFAPVHLADSPNGR